MLKQSVQRFLSAAFSFQSKEKGRILPPSQFCYLNARRHVENALNPRHLPRCWTSEELKTELFNIAI